MQSTVPVSPFQCAVCSNSFTRLEHLQRHLLAHSDSRPYGCTFCSLNFNRRDTLTRHWRTCEARINSGHTTPKLSRRKKGRKQHSCDRCSQLKRRCSRTFPCDKCVGGTQECTYLRFLQDVDIPSATAQLPTPVPDNNQGQSPSSSSDTRLDVPWAISQEESMASGPPIPDVDSLISFPHPHYAAKGVLFPNFAQHLPPTWGPLLTHNHEASGPIIPWVSQLTWNVYDMAAYAPSFAPPRPSVRPVRLNFLAKFTSTKGIANSFDCGNPEERRRVILILMNTAGRPDRLSTSDAGRALMFQQQLLVHPLAAKTHEIVLGINQYHHANTSDGINWQDSLALNESLCHQFFSPANLDRYLLAFWSFWYPNWPVFHKPSFDPTRTPARLLATIAIIGACLTPEDADRDTAMHWLGAVEEWVFTDPAFSDDDTLDGVDEPDMAAVRDRLDALRAAYCIILVCSWEGKESQKRRARRTRYSQVISVARSLQVSGLTTHGNLGANMRIRNALGIWQRFVLKEELIRTVTYVFLLDMGYVIFNNTPPRMVTFELDVGLTCPETCFQAEDLESWLFSVKAWSETSIGQEQPSVSSMMEGLMKDEVSPGDWKILRQMSSLNFFTLASALHGLIFHHHCQPTSWNQATPILHGLRNWRQAWLQREELCGLREPGRMVLNDAWRRIGFMRFAAEYWYLGCIVYKRAESMQTLRADWNKTVSGPFKKGFLERYDNSDMRQVHDLVVQFQDMRLGAEIM